MSCLRHWEIRVPDDLWTKIKIEFYSDAADAVFKTLAE